MFEVSSTLVNPAFSKLISFASCKVVSLNSFALKAAGETEL